MADESATPIAAGASGGPFLSRVREWFWRRGALEQARARARTLGPEQRAHYERARTSAVVAERVVDPDAPLGGFDEALPAQPARALALSLLREAAHWALLAYAPAGSPPGTLAEALERAPADVVRGAAGGDDAGLAATRAALVARDYVATATLSPEALEADLAAARRFVRALVEGLEVRERVIPRLYFERAVRVGALAALVLVVALLVPALRRLTRTNWVAQSDWRTSSTIEGWSQRGRGVTPRAAAPFVFFHTQAEPNPWIEFDLGAPRTVSELLVVNRSDCCGERAVPLALELSDDAQSWREVARRAAPFDRWRETFPRQQARFARLRALHADALHLESVELR